MSCGRDGLETDNESHAVMHRRGNAHEHLHGGEIPCDRCEGAGRVEMHCPRCFGVGHLARPEDGPLF
jgi:RecJ-like exonuclease